MIDEYKDVTFIKADAHRYLTFKDGAFRNIAFDLRLIDSTFENLIAGSPVVYLGMNNMFGDMEKLCNIVENGVADSQLREVLSSVIFSVRQMQTALLTFMRISEVGVPQVSKEHLADEKSKNKS